MALQSTSKIRLFVPSSQESSVLGFLQSQSVMEVVKSDEQLRTDVEHSGEFAADKLEFSIKYLSRFENKKKGIRNSVLGEKIEISEVEKKDIIDNFQWEGVSEKISQFEVENTDTERKISELKLEISSLQFFKDCDIENRVSKFSPLYFIVSERNKEKVKSEIINISSLLELEEVSSRDGKIAYVVFAQAEIFLEIKALLVKESAHEVAIALDKSPKDVLKIIEAELEKCNAVLRNIKDNSEVLAQDIDALKVLYDEYASQKEKEYALRKVTNGEFISVVEGWVVTSHLNALENALSKKYNKQIALEVIEKSEKESSRVVLNSSSLMSPIMEVTKMFGIPKIEEVDPTPYYAFFFVLFFGLCLTDAGYGLILAGMMAFAIFLRLPFEKEVINVIRLFMYGGISTFVMGVLFGGWFGLSPDQVSPSFTYVRESDGVLLFIGQIFNPMTDLTSRIMPITYILGVLHLSLGLYLSGLIAWKSGDKNRMFFVTIPLISSFIFASLAWVAEIEIFQYAFFASLLAAAWGLGKSGNPVLRISKGFGGLLNESLGWFSNILSYSRLFALGLATGIIAMAFNIVALTIGGLLPGLLGWLVMILVLAFGHTLNIALNVLGAYVHSSRLQFVEFFGMFLEGGGKILKPLRKVCRFRHTS